MMEVLELFYFLEFKNDFHCKINKVSVCFALFTYAEHTATNFWRTLSLL
jgi:hypothetical protein